MCIFQAMNLYILRHGIAVEPGTPGYEKDSDRPLIPKGRRQLKQIAGAMKRMDLRFDLVVSSPLLRAEQTAEIITGSLKLEARSRISDALKPDGNPITLVRQLNELNPVPEAALLVGHQPNLSRLISLLTAGDTDLVVDLKKGGLCKLEAASLQPGRCAMLTWLLTPKQMRWMA